MLLAGTTAGAASAQPQTQTAPHPIVSVPVTGPGAMLPGLRRVPAGTAWEDHGHVVTEYFVSEILPEYAGQATDDAEKVRIR